MSKLLFVLLAAMAALFAPLKAMASTVSPVARLDLTNHFLGYLGLAVFVVAYYFVVREEKYHMKKSIPVLMAAGVIWVLLGTAYKMNGTPEQVALLKSMADHQFMDFGQLFLFLLAAMTFINTLEERQVFEWIRVKIMNKKNMTLRKVFWLTGLCAFSMSPLADNMTTALALGAIAIAVGKAIEDSAVFVSAACVNIVVAANAGGAFSPFGDITTLMVWQAGILPFFAFFKLFVPSLVNWLVPAFIMSLAVSNKELKEGNEKVELLPGAIGVIVLFLGTIASAVTVHMAFHLPPVLGMMAGLGALKLYGYFLKKDRHLNGTTIESTNPFEEFSHKGAETFDVFKMLEKAEWDTYMFFYGVVLCVGGLGTAGYLEMLAQLAYNPDIVHPVVANVAVGGLSALVDNIPVMLAVLLMHPTMSESMWLLVTLTAGVGGSLLSVGSAAGVALMGQAKDIYTFKSHLRWTPAVALGFAVSVGVHILILGV